MSVISKRFHFCTICASPIADPLELLYCSPECRAVGRGVAPHSTTQGQDLPAGIAFRDFDGTLKIARVLGQTPGSFQIEHGVRARAVSRVEVLYRFRDPADLKRAERYLAQHRRALNEADRRLLDLLEPFSYSTR